jgi:hypothetical protein
MYANRPSSRLASRLTRRVIMINNVSRPCAAFHVRNGLQLSLNKIDLYRYVGIALVLIWRSCSPLSVRNSGRSEKAKSRCNRVNTLSCEINALDDADTADIFMELFRGVQETTGGPITQACCHWLGWTVRGPSKLGRASRFAKRNLLRTCSVSSWTKEPTCGPPQTTHCPEWNHHSVGHLRRCRVGGEGQRDPETRRAPRRGDGQVEHQAWSVDILRLQSAGEEALAEAAEAELIVFAGPRSYSLPPWLKDWLECWVSHRHPGEAALAVMRTGTGEKPSSPSMLEYQFATRR